MISLHQKGDSAAEWAPRTSLKPWGKNPRRNDPAVRKVADSIQRFGFGAPLLARRETREVIAGHTRLKAAEVLGLDLVPVRWLDLSEREAHLLALADNRLGELAEWDDAAVAAILSEYSLDEADLAGWSAKDLEEIGASLDPGEPAADAEPQVDKAEELRQRWNVEAGQTWRLGRHTVWCGDSLGTDLPSHLAGASMVFTDPPYDLPAEEQVRVVFSLSDVCVVSGCGPEYARLAGVSGVRYWYEVISVRQMPRSMPRWPGPFVLHWQNAFFTKGGPHLFHRRNAKGRFGNGDYFPSVRGPYKCAEHDHGHSKPTEWANELISMCEPAPVVADPFLGSGTTLIACEQLGRTCLAAEIDPGYVAVAIQRWVDATGGTPERLP